MSKPTAVLFDLDGVLAHNSERLHYFIENHEVADKMPNWDSWYASLPEDDSRPEYVALARMAHDAGHAVLVLTSRPEKLREATSQWLRFHVPFGVNRLSMWDTRSPFSESKRIELEDLLIEFDIILALDDAIQWVELFRSYGIPTVHINDGFRVIASLDKQGFGVKT